jgi:hypothetical protein
VSISSTFSAAKQGRSFLMLLMVDRIWPKKTQNHCSSCAKLKPKVSTLSAIIGEIEIERKRILTQKELT